MVNKALHIENFLLKVPVIKGHGLSAGFSPLLLDI